MATLNFIGHSAFTIDHDGKTIVIDPFITGNPMAKISADEVTPSAILVTHGHNDHVGDAVELSKRTGAPIIEATRVIRLAARRNEARLSRSSAKVSSICSMFSAVTSSSIPANVSRCENNS